MVVNIETMNPFLIINQRIMIRFVSLVLASLSISSDKLELNCSIGIFDSFILLKCSSAPPSIEIGLQPENYCE